MTQPVIDNSGDPWLPDLQKGTGPIYLRISEALANARANGLLQPGDRLPAQRELARRLGVDLTTITRAFTEARRRNLIDAAPGRGTFVTPGEAEEPILDLSMNIPPPPLGISLPALIRSGVAGLLKRSSADALLSYHPDPGSPAERAAGSLWLERTGPRLPVERVAVGAGAQALLAALLTSMSREGDVVLADRLTYPGFITRARSLGRKPAGVEGDENGMRPDGLEAAAAQTGARLLYVNPTLQNPTTLTMPEHRRRELIGIARRVGITIIEDDPYSRLLATPEPSFLALAPDVTFHVATLAKCVSPFLRTAFLVAPDGGALDVVAGCLRSLTLMAPPLMTGLAAEWIRSGIAGDIAEGVTREAKARQAAAATILPGDLRDREGFHLWLPRQDAPVVAQRARDRGLAVSEAEGFAIGQDAPEALRISLGAISDRRRLSDALQSLAIILRQRSSARDTVV